MFAAVVPPDEVLEDLEEFLAPRREAGAFRWTVREQWHLTLAFMPDVAERHLDDLVERLTRAGRRRTPFTLRVAGGGAFPNAGRARVLWAGVEADEHARTELDRLATGARAAATKAGAAPEGGRFRAHVTLARLGRPAELSRWVRLLDAYRGPAWEVTELALIASHLGEGPRKRPRYELVDSFALGA
jgi:2'-5' RNA ligase